MRLNFFHFVINNEFEYAKILDISQNAKRKMRKTPLGIVFDYVVLETSLQTCKSQT